MNKNAKWVRTGADINPISPAFVKNTIVLSPIWKLYIMTVKSGKLSVYRKYEEDGIGYEINIPNGITAEIRIADNVQTVGGGKYTYRTKCQ